MSSIIQVRNLNFGYTSELILKNVNFDIDVGDFVCITGANGCGKSTLLKLLLNIVSPQNGSILIGGQPTKFNNHATKKISYVPQKSTYFNHDFPATVNEIVDLGIGPYFSKIFHKKDVRQKKIDDALSKVGMLNFKDKKIGRLSGGQQQRVIIAKALVSNPQILFLDEPTVGIDNCAVNSICCLLGELNTKYKITILMVTHDVLSIVYHASKIMSFDGVGNVKISKPDDSLLNSLHNEIK